MAIIHKSIADLGKGRVDQAKLDATTENDIRRHMIEDGFDPDNPFEGLREIDPRDKVAPQESAEGVVGFFDDESIVPVEVRMTMRANSRELADLTN
jgi:hypothetical protein